MRDNICAFTSVCGEDECWLNQYLDEVERLAMPFCIHLDRCPYNFEVLFKSHPLCKIITRQLNPKIEFNETHKQRVFDALVDLGKYTWAMPWDIDETWELAFWKKAEKLDPETMSCVDVPWLNMWEDETDAGRILGEKMVRIDGPFASGHRVKFYNLKAGLQWTWKSQVVNGPKPSRHVEQSRLPIICVHHGMKTLALRELHKERWDRIYTTANRGDPNPYGFWDYSLNEKDYPPVVCSLAERMAYYD